MCNIFRYAAQTIHSTIERDTREWKPFLSTTFSLKWTKKKQNGRQHRTNSYLRAPSNLKVYRERKKRIRLSICLDAWCKAKYEAVYNIFLQKKKNETKIKKNRKQNYTRANIQMQNSTANKVNNTRIQSSSIPAQPTHTPCQIPCMNSHMKLCSLGKKKNNKKKDVYDNRNEITLLK